MKRALKVLGRSLAPLFCLGFTLLLASSFLPYPLESLYPEGGEPLIIEDRNGRVLRRLPAGGRGGAREGRSAWVPLERISSHAILTLLASEDQRFFEHEGIDPYSVLRALVLNLRAGGIEYGASTLTMQLMRMVHSPGKPRTLTNKLREMHLALRVERVLSKREILEQYLNRAYYGHGAHGIDAAARRYFGKPAASLSLGEASLLTVLPRNPSYYDPTRHRGRALRRRQHLLSLLVEQGKLEAAAAQRATAEPLEFARADSSFEAGHFVDWLLQELPEELRARGGVVRSTLDLELNRALERRVREHVDALRARGAEQAGAVVLDSQSGQVLAMVGSAGFDLPGGQLNIVTRRRHPGSALKPFVYATAIERGESPASIAFDAFDVASAYRVRELPPREHGPSRYRQALAGSYNLAAVQVLEKVGIGAVMDTLRRAGVGSLEGDIDDYGPRLALGSAKVRLLDLAASYGFLVRDGMATHAQGLLRFTPPGEAPLLSPAPPEQRVVSAQAAWLTLDMLADPEARRKVFGTELAADLPYPVAVKTGTARGFADTVAIFATTELTAAAWTGRFDGQPTRGLSGMEAAAPLARTALLLASAGRPLQLPEAPEGLVAAAVCPLSGKRPAAGCPHQKRELFIEGSVPQAPCDWHRRQASGAVHVRYPPELAGWAARHGKRQRAGG
ncbi:MAG: transglycosylase domain-containing protein [Myxococcales bacterium]|nr:transglycosylase domain-containing protein [Myxococcales bacterium]